MSTSQPLSDHDAALAYLNGRINYEREATLPFLSRGLKLDHMRQLLARLGNPHQQYPIVHVAGTKGKGSTAAMIAAIMSAAGCRVGLYTSPHVECVEERMAIAGQPCSGAEFVEVLRQVREVVDDFDREAGAGGPPLPGASYFEITTACALLHFQRRGVDAAVVEVGLGGRTDSTNVCQPVLAVITSISLDHTRQLGSTLASIAEHKAGIIKPGVPVVSGVVAAEPRAVIERIAAECGCRYFQLERDFAVRYRGTQVLREADGAAGAGPAAWTTFDYEEHCGPTPQSLSSLIVALPGKHQAANAAVALAAIGRLREQGWQIPEAAVRAGLAHVHMPARTEILRRRPTVIIDAAHNVASVRALLEVLRETYPPDRTRRRILVFAASRDKDVTNMLEPLLGEFDTAIMTRFLNNPRAASAETLQKIAAQLLAAQRTACCQLLTADSSAEAWELARSLARAEDLICIAGSFFLASEIRGLAATP